MKETPLAAFYRPDEMSGLGAGEVAYLLGRQGPASEQSRDLLMLEPRRADDGTLPAGAASLVSRGWPTIHDNGTGETAPTRPWWSMPWGRRPAESVPGTGTAGVHNEKGLQQAVSDLYPEVARA